MKKENLIFNYAQALALYAQEKKAFAEVSGDYRHLQGLLWDDLAARAYFLFPGIETTKKKELLLRLRDDFGLEEGLFRFLCLLVDEERFNLFSQIQERFQRLAYFYTRKAEVKIVSAFALSRQDEQAIGAVLEKILKKEVVIEKKVDKDILGGFRIDVATEGLTIDDSLKRRLEKLKQYVGQ